MLGDLNQRQRVWVDHSDAWFSAVTQPTADPFQRPHTARITSLTSVALCGILPRTAKPLDLQPAAQCPVTRSNHHTGAPSTPQSLPCVIQFDSVA